MRFPDAGARDADTFTHRFEAEQGVGTRGGVFMGDKRSVLIENLALERNGVFAIRES
jgi:hypothetical protein